MDIKDLVGLNQPLTKLIEVIAKGIGGVSKPFFTGVNAEFHRDDPALSVMRRAPRAGSVGRLICANIRAYQR